MKQTHSHRVVYHALKLCAWYECTMTEKDCLSCHETVRFKNASQKRVRQCSEDFVDIKSDSCDQVRQLPEKFVEIKFELRSSPTVAREFR